MSTSTAPSQTVDPAVSQADMMSAMFANMVIQNTNMALVFLGKAPNPQTGKVEMELEHARYFIDQLEMLSFKTKGNLDRREEALLNQSLTHLRMSFVEAVDHPAQFEPQPAEPPAATSDQPSPPSPPVDEQETPVNDPPLPGEKADDMESHKRFTKKY